MWPNPRKQLDRTFKRPTWDTAVMPGGLQGFFFFNTEATTIRNYK